MATSASTDKFRIAAQGYLNDGRFSDFTIVCGDKEFKVHRCFISAHSKYFEKACDGMFQESTTRSITLREDSLAAVEMMIHFFYTCDYDDRVVLRKDDQGNDVVRNTLCVNADVYAIADKYDIPDLKALALEKSKIAAKAIYMHPARMLGAVRHIYTKVQTMASDTALRALVVDAWRMGGSALHEGVGKEKFTELVRQAPEFAADLTIRFAAGFEQHGNRKRLYCSGCNRYAEYSFLSPATKWPVDTSRSSINCGCNTSLKEQIGLIGTVMVDKFW